MKAPVISERYDAMLRTNVSMDNYLKSATSGAFAILAYQCHLNGDTAWTWVFGTLFAVAIVLLKFEGRIKGIGVLWDAWEVAAFVGTSAIRWCEDDDYHLPHRWTYTYENVTEDGHVWGSTDYPGTVCLGHDCDDPMRHM